MSDFLERRRNFFNMFTLLSNPLPSQVCRFSNEKLSGESVLFTIASVLSLLGPLQSFSMAPYYATRTFWSNMKFYMLPPVLTVQPGLHPARGRRIPHILLN